MVLFLAEWCYF